MERTTVLLGGRLDPDAHEAMADAHEERARVWQATGEASLARIERSRMLIHRRAAQIKRDLASTATPAFDADAALPLDSGRASRNPARSRQLLPGIPG